MNFLKLQERKWKRPFVSLLFSPCERTPGKIPVIKNIYRYAEKKEKKKMKDFLKIQ